MPNRKIVRFLLLAPFILFIFVFGFGQAVLHLWNWLMPVLFGLPTITFGQAWGLLGLSWILFGGFRGFGGSARHPRHGRHEAWERRKRWQEMTPEQRAALREALDKFPGSPPAGAPDTGREA
jgi:hypothetical protein